MKSFVKVMKALSDPNRIKILKMLQNREMCVCELREALRVSQPTVSKHLKILQEADLVNSSKDGQWVNYFLTQGNDSPYAAILLANLKLWLESDPEIIDLKEKLPYINREEIS